MPRLNIQKAKELGFTDEQIQQHLAQNPGLAPIGMGSSMSQEQQPDALHRLADWLPIAGGVAGSFTPLGPIAGGAIGSGAGALAKQLIQGKPVDAGEIGKETLLGGAGGVVSKVAAPIIRGAGRIGGRMLGETIPETAAQAVIKSSPAQFTRAGEVGVNLNKAFVKHSPFLGNTFDDMLGPIGRKAAGAKQIGNINKRIGVFENEIKSVVKEAGSATKISGSEIVKALRQELANEKAVLGNDARVGILEGLIKEAEKGYKNGTTVGKALTKLRIANRQFGRSILEDQTGSMISSAQKLEANVLRNKLKTLFPSMANALDNEQELILLKEVLSGARSKSLTGGSLGLAEIDVTKPGTLLKYLLGNPRVGTEIARTGAKETAEAGIAGAVKGGIPGKQIAGESIAQSGTRALLDPQSPQETASTDTSMAPDEGSPLTDFTGESAKQKKIKEAFTIAMMQNPKQAKTLKDIYDFGFAGSEGMPGDNVGKTTAKDYGLAKSGLKNVKDVRKLYEEDPSVLTKQLIPGQFASRKFDSAVYDAADTLLRLRTGAQANPSEIRGYMKKIAPTFGDSPDVVNYKLAKLESDLAFYLQGGTAPSSLQDFGAEE